MSKYGVFSGPYFPNSGKYGPENTTYLDTFHAVTPKFTAPLNNQYSALKEERNLHQGPPDIDWTGYFGTYEVSIAPKCLFILGDGNLHKCNDKDTVADDIYNLQVSRISWHSNWESVTERPGLYFSME